MKSNKYKILRTFIKPYTGYLVIAFLCVTLTTILNTIMPQIVAFTVDSVIGDIAPELPHYFEDIFSSLGGRDYFVNNLWIFGAILIIIAIISGIANYIFRISITTSSQGVTRDMRNKLYIHIQKLPFSWHSSHQTGDIIQRATSDMDVINGFVSNHIIETIRILLLVCITLSLMIAMNFTLSLVAVAFIPIIVGYTTIFYSKIYKQFMKTDEAEGALMSVIQENLTGIRVVKAFGRESFEMDKFDEKNFRFFEIWKNLGTTMGLYWGLADFFTGIQNMTVIAVGVVFAINGELTLGELIAFLSYNTMIIWPIRRLGRMSSEVSKMGVSLERVAYILEAEEEDANENGSTEEITGDIVYDNVCYSYENDSREVLKNISFHVKSGKTLGILGGTGSGKSTLVHLLNRLYDPTDGSVMIDNISTKDYRLSHLRENVGMVLQEPFLFSKTIKDNIAISGDVGEDSVQKAATTASIHSSILSFKDGYETIVGERGVTLSGGQKQRVAIARMLTKSPPIMVFDDSLSALDSETDFAIRNALRSREEKSTTIIISHRINSIMHADEIIVLKDGSIAERGSHKSLLEQDSIYKKIYDIQFSNEDMFIEEVKN